VARLAVVEVVEHALGRDAVERAELVHVDAGHVTYEEAAARAEAFPRRRDVALAHVEADVVDRGHRLQHVTRPTADVEHARTRRRAAQQPVDEDAFDVGGAERALERVVDARLREHRPQPAVPLSHRRVLRRACRRPAP
jgi:hypothetical protein